MIGDFAVGKTSLVARFVSSTYSEKYITTVGVKIDTKNIALDSGQEMKLVLWDIAGDDDFCPPGDRGAKGIDVVKRIDILIDRMQKSSEVFFTLLTIKDRVVDRITKLL